MMRDLSRLIGLSAFIGLTAIGIAACEDSPVGPSLSAVPVSNLALKPSQGNPGLCCCHVTAWPATTTPCRPRHDQVLGLQRAARAERPGEPLSTILYFIKDLQPGQTHQIEAPGFIFPCDQIPEGIKNVKTEVEVKGITYPPF